MSGRPDWMSELATCEEASPLSHEHFIACAAPAVAMVYHSREGKAFAMCAGCAEHNVRNRGAMLLQAADNQAELRARLNENFIHRLALCPDHRDEASGRWCVVCQAEKRTRQEYATSKKEQ